jgi:phage terminase Nu1 subunit (DNA packaging protein)
MADFLGISRRQVERFVEKGMPRDGTGNKARFGPSAFKWYREYQARQNGAGQLVGKLAEEQARKTKIDADRAELRLLREQSQVVPVRTVREMQGRINAVIKARLLAFPGKMAPQVFGMDNAGAVKSKLEIGIYELLTTLASEGKRVC